MTIVLWSMLIFLFFYLVRAIKGPSAWDRLMVMNVISTKIIVIIIIIASINEMPFLLDFAIIYALFGFIGAIFIALFLSERSQSSQGKKD